MREGAWWEHKCSEKSKRGVILQKEIFERWFLFVKWGWLNDYPGVDKFQQQQIYHHKCFDWNNISISFLIVQRILNYYVLKF